MTSGNRNRQAGHSWELEIVNALKKIGFIHAVTSRSESRSRDDQKIDVINKDEYTNGRLPYNIQAKTTAKAVNYPKHLSELPSKEGQKEINVVFHRQTKKSEAGRFLVKGKYAILNFVDFLGIIEKLERLQKGFKIFMDNFDYFPQDEQQRIHDELRAVGC